MNEFKIISENLKSMREQKGYTQEKLAEMVGLSASHISKVESGQRRVGMKTYLHILRALGAEPEEYVMCALGERNKSSVQRLKMLLEDCTENEIEFLLANLAAIKENMRKFSPG